jgi:Tfp pilus assembly protein PilF
MTGAKRRTRSAEIRKRGVKPDYAQAHSSLGLLYWNQNDHSKALEEFRQAVMSDPDLPEPHYNLGLALAQSGHLDEATRELKEAISLDPKYTDARIQLGLVLSQNNDIAGAANVFRELCADPNFAEAHNNLVGAVAVRRCAQGTGEFSEAVRSTRYAEAHYIWRWPFTRKERRRNRGPSSSGI